MFAGIDFADSKSSRRSKGSRKKEESPGDRTEDVSEDNRLPASFSSKSVPSPRQGQRQFPPDPPQEGGYRATGVEYVQNGVTKRVYLKTSIITMESAPFSRVGVRSVILSAGAVMTPTLLMNSGIGPRETLEGAGIKVLLAAEAVGRNLQNQPAVGVTVTLREEALAGVEAVYMSRDQHLFNIHHFTTAFRQSTLLPFHSPASTILPLLIHVCALLLPYEWQAILPPTP
jgi:GMC oxidoreductase